MHNTSTIESMVSIKIIKRMLVASRCRSRLELEKKTCVSSLFRL